MIKSSKEISAAKAAVEFHFNAFKSLVLSDFVKKTRIRRCQEESSECHPDCVLVGSG